MRESSKSSRRRFFASALGAAAATAVLRYPANAAEFTLKWAMPGGPTQPHTIRGAEACKKIEAESGGRLQMQFFPGSILGDVTSMLSQVRSGAIQIYGAVGLDLAAIAPLCALEGIAFAFPTADKIYEASDGALGAAVRNGIRNVGLFTFDKIGLVGYLNVMNSRKPILAPTDLPGLKLRVPPAATEIAIWKALGASTVSLNSPEIYPALQTHLVDGVVTALSALETFKWYELTKYVSITHHSFASQTIVANDDAMQALPKALLEIVERNVNASQLEERADMAKLDDSLEKSFQSRGLQITKPDLGPFKAAIRTAKLYEAWRSQFGDQNWSLLERYTGPLG